MTYAPDELVIVCSCSYLHHAVCFTFHPTGPRDQETFEAYVQVSLDYEQSWWGRLRTAMRYLLRRTCGYGVVSEIIVSAHDLPKIRAWVERAQRDAEKRTRTVESKADLGQ
jgi:hypothetical protein